MRAERAAWVSRPVPLVVVLTASSPPDIYMRAARMLPSTGRRRGHVDDDETRAPRGKRTSVSWVRGWPGSPRPAACARPGARSWCSRRETASGDGSGRSTSRDGVPIDMGACFVGPHHDRMHALAQEMGVATFKTFVDGDNVLATGGKVRRYRGDIPRISPVALLSAGQGIARLNAMAKKVPVDAPWDAPKAARLGRAVGASLAQRGARADPAGPRPDRGDRAGLLRRRPLRGLTPQLALPGALGERR